MLAISVGPNPIVQHPGMAPISKSKYNAYGINTKYVSLSYVLYFMFGVVGQSTDD